MDGRAGRSSVERQLSWLVLAVAVAAWVAPRVRPDAAAAPASPAGPKVAVQPATVALSGSVHPEALSKFEAGRVDAGMHLSGMSLLFRMSPRQSALQRYALAAMQDPASTSYHQWLTPEQYAAEFGASSGDIARATEWLTAQGLAVDGASRTATRLAFSGTVGQIEQAFHTEMHRYVVDGANHFAMSLAPSVPADLADLILGLHGMHDFRAKAASQRLQSQYVLAVTGSDGGPGTYPVLGPADFAKIYDVDSLYAAHVTGAGQSIAVVEQSDFNDADIAAFRTTFGLPNNPPLRVLVPNSGTAAINETLDEAELNLEWAGAVAPDATIRSVFTGHAPNTDVLDALMYAIEQRTAPVVSTSFGRCEAWFTSADASFLEGYGAMAALEGVTVLVAAGDAGAAGCDSQSALMAQYGKSVVFPASVPSFVAVGGSQFQLTSTNQSTYLDTQFAAISYIPESAWNETLFDIDAGYGGLGAGGGGPSRLFAKPYWQVPFAPNDGFRDVPDVALSASADILPYAVSMSGAAPGGDAQAAPPQVLTAFGGTSVATPALAGIFALVNQAVAEANPGAPAGLGNANPMLYALANNAASRNAFHDVTTGDNIVPCAEGSADCPSSPPYRFGYTAGPGYDLVSGLGSIDAANLAAAWETMSPTSTSLRVTAAGTAAGSALQLTAIVASKATANAMTGSVTFYFLASGDGGVGISGSLGTSQVTPSTSSSTEGGSVSLTAHVPGGFAGSGVQIGAFYGGDANYLASWSAWTPVSGTSDLAICPAAVTLAAGQTGFTFTTTGGSPPIRWSMHADDTCTAQGAQIVCSSIDGGAFAAGPKAGSATVVAIDQDDTYVTAAVTVNSVGDGGLGPFPAISCGSDGGGPDSSRTGSEDDAEAGSEGSEGPQADAQAVDGSLATATPQSSDSGCGCYAAGADSRHIAAGWASAALLAALAVVRRFFSRTRLRQGTA